MNSFREFTAKGQEGVFGLYLLPGHLTRPLWSLASLSTFTSSSSPVRPSVRPPGLQSSRVSGGERRHCVLGEEAGIRSDSCDVNLGAVTSQLSLCRFYSTMNEGEGLLSVSADYPQRLSSLAIEEAGI